MTQRSSLIRIVGVALAMISAAGSAAGPQSDNLVGRNVPPYPAGLDELQGSCIAGGPSQAQVCDYSLTVIGRFAADPAMEATSTQLLALRNLDTGERQARWNVTDAVAVPKPRKGYALQIGSCRVDRVDNPGVVAFVRHGDREYSRDVRWARQFDIASGRLLPVASKRVDCVNEGLGV
jgi:hypothetical protein